MVDADIHGELEEVIGSLKSLEGVREIALHAEPKVVLHTTISRLALTEADGILL